MVPHHNGCFPEPPIASAPCSSWGAQRRACATEGGVVVQHRNVRGRQRVCRTPRLLCRLRDPAARCYACVQWQCALAALSSAPRKRKSVAELQCNTPWLRLRHRDALYGSQLARERASNRKCARKRPARFWPAALGGCMRHHVGGAAAAHLHLRALALRAQTVLLPPMMLLMLGVC